MPKYQCPECEAILKRETPVPEGKKIKCPKCEMVFLPVSASEGRSAPAPVAKQGKAAKPAAKNVDDDDEEIGGKYSLAEEEDDPNAKKAKKKREVNYGSLRDKFEKSKRGPAMARLVGLSNGMLFLGALTVLGGIVGTVVGLWPFVFSEQSPTGSRQRDALLTAFGSLLTGVYGGCMCYGASKMHDLESYGWSWASAILTAIMGVGTAITGIVMLFKAVAGEHDDSFDMMIGLLSSAFILAWGGFGSNVGIKSITRLKEEDIKAGFEETQEMVEY